jgi:hypothetical protein
MVITVIPKIIKVILYFLVIKEVKELAVLIKLYGTFILTKCKAMNSTNDANFTNNI